MSSELWGRQTAERLVEQSFHELERKASEANYQPRLIRRVGNVARLLAREDLVERATRLLRDAPEKVPGYVHSILPRKELERQHPVYQESKALELVRASARRDKHIALCLEGRYEEAFKEARSQPYSDTAMEELAETQAMLGDFDAALETVNYVSHKDRQIGALIVITVELFRRGQFEKALTVFTDLESRQLGISNSCHLARGFIGREPWGGYPYPDY